MDEMDEMDARPVVPTVDPIDHEYVGDGLGAQVHCKTCRAPWWHHPGSRRIKARNDQLRRDQMEYVRREYIRRNESRPGRIRAASGSLISALDPLKLGIGPDPGGDT